MDWTAISGIITGLTPSHPDLASLADSETAIAELRTVLVCLVSYRRSSKPTVEISHEPWGEVTINFGVDQGAKIYCGPVRFVTPDVALADASAGAQQGIASVKRMLFVMRRVGGEWKIASARILAPTVFQ